LVTNEQDGSGRRDRSRRDSIFWLVLLGALLMTATLPGRTHCLGLITKRVIEDLHFSTVSYAYLNFWATLIDAGPYCRRRCGDILICL
jgi:hypothetical protein